MGDANKVVLSAVDEVNILYNLKDLVRRYRTGAANGKLVEQICKAYIQALPVAAQAKEQSISEILTDTVRSSKDYLTTLLEDVNVEQIKLSPQIVDMADQQTIADFDNIHQKISSIDKTLKEKQEQFQNVGKTSTAKTAKKQTSSDTNLQDDEVVSSIKEEIKAVIMKKHEGDKAMLKALETCESIGVSRNRSSYIFTIGTYEFKTGIAVDGACFQDENGRIDKSIKSRYRKITDEAFKELSAVKKSKIFATAIGKAAGKQAKAIAQKAKSDKAKEKKLAQEKESLTKEISQLIEEREAVVGTLKKTVQSIIKNLDNYKLFEALALNNSAGKSLLKSLLPKQNTDGYQDKLRNMVFDGAVYSPDVWCLYEAPENKMQSHYQKSIEKSVGINRKAEISNLVRDFMTGYDAKSSNQDIVINQIAGTSLPREIAKDIFLQEVFSYGMALANKDKFSDSRFTVMNQIMAKHGYRISFKYITTEKECPEGAREISDDILKDMHKKGGCKDKKNKQIALLAGIGRACKLGSKADNFLMNELYNSFVDCYFNGNKKIDYRLEWKKFAQENKEQAKRLYQHLEANAPSPEHLDKWIKSLSRGDYISGKNTVQKQTDHHVIERKYGGLFDDYNRLYNNEDNVASTASFHPCDDDPHRLAHLFDTKEVYFTFVDGIYQKHNSIKTIKKGSTLAIPFLEIKGKDGNFHPAIESNTLLITSQCERFTQPFVAGSGLRTNLSNICTKTPPSNGGNGGNGK
ncbi:MAG: hypothetical protein E7017_03410 [Alphaproteobacteria bacterium]|nr:hypothetical protein [Alphaproteobacteria bacterium]